MMKKKTIIISAIAGIIILGLCIKLAVGSRDVSVIENTALEERVVSDESNGQDKVAIPITISRMMRRKKKKTMKIYLRFTGFLSENDL